MGWHKNVSAAAALVLHLLTIVTVESSKSKWTSEKPNATLFQLCPAVFCWSLSLNPHVGTKFTLCTTYNNVLTYITCKITLEHFLTHGSQTLSTALFPLGHATRRNKTVQAHIKTVLHTEAEVSQATVLVTVNGDKHFVVLVVKTRAQLEPLKAATNKGISLPHLWMWERDGRQHSFLVLLQLFF